MKRPALFLDRDGVVNVDHGYVCTAENFQFVEGIFELVSTANRLNYLVVVVTNQSGIGRGYYSEADFVSLTSWMISEFSRNSCNISAVYFCPYHPEFGIGRYRIDSMYRKPNPGMLMQAARDLNIDLPSSIMIGDKITDIDAGFSAGVGTLLHIGGGKIDLRCRNIENLIEATKYMHNGDLA